MRQIILIIAAICIFSFSLQAQGEFSGGFKTGLNFSSFDGPTETDGESFSSNIGFHIGATFVYSITDLFGIKGELLYSQKGTEQKYDGPSYLVFYSSDEATTIIADGQRSSDLSVANSYIDIPLMVYYRIGRLELEAGANAAILVGSSGSGGITFSGRTPQGDIVEEFNLLIDARYFGDDPGLASVTASENFILNNRNVIRPTDIGGYYEVQDNDTKRFKRLDFGLNVGLAFFLNKGLYVGGRLNYGLTDLTNTEQDFALSERSTDGEYITRDDVDRNLSIQASIGFRF